MLRLAINKDSVQLFKDALKNLRYKDVNNLTRQTYLFENLLETFNPENCPKITRYIIEKYKNLPATKRRFGLIIRKIIQHKTFLTDEEKIEIIRLNTVYNYDFLRTFYKFGISHNLAIACPEFVPDEYCIAEQVFDYSEKEMNELLDLVKKKNIKINVRVIYNAVGYRMDTIRYRNFIYYIKILFKHGFYIPRHPLRIFNIRHNADVLSLLYK